jgi:hypothetical protein
MKIIYLIAMLSAILVSLWWGGCFEYSAWTGFGKFLKEVVAPSCGVLLLVFIFLWGMMGLSRNI